jgi:chromatin remodeling complex protein RSC6
MPSNKQTILPNEKLLSILKVDDDVKLTNFTIQKYIKHQYGKGLESPTPPVEAAKAEKKTVTIDLSSEIQPVVA